MVWLLKHKTLLSLAKKYVIRLLWTDPSPEEHASITFCLFVSHLFHTFLNEVLCSSGAKQKAAGGGGGGAEERGCHRQIKSLQLMHCGDMEETGAAPQTQAPAQFGEKAPNF